MGQKIQVSRLLCQSLVLYVLGRDDAIDAIHFITTLLDKKYLLTLEGFSSNVVEEFQADF